MRGWRPALLIAWRDALRHRGRSALVLVMISLPVLAVSAAAVVLRTADVSGPESTQRIMGAADARIRTEGRGPVIQDVDPTKGAWSQVGDFDAEHPPTADDLRAVLGADARLVPISSSFSRARLGERIVDFTTTGVDLSDPAAAGLFDLEDGRLPRAPGEVVVNRPMLAKGFALGGDLDVDGTALTIVGVGRDATAYDRPVVIGAVADLPTSGDNVHEWLVVAGPVSWSQVRELNQVGFLVTSRAVLADPPDLASAAEQMGYDTGRDELVAVVALIVVMALIEVVLLAGPAFAVGARRHARTLALIAASGGTPAQARRVVLGSGVVLGLVASTLGLVLGVLTGWALLPVVQRWNGDWFGPFELPWRYLAAITVFGLLSALLASAVPAWLASRQDVVAVLAGRRGDRSPRASTPVVGLGLVALGAAGSAYGSVNADNGRGGLLVAASAVVLVLGMILVVPVVVATVARAAGRLPLAARYAARDADRHRTRTVPAVAAVAATVAGVVALGIAATSQELAHEQAYVPEAPMGTGRLTWSPDLLVGEQAPPPGPTWDRIEQQVHAAAPDVRVQAVRGGDEYADGGTSTSTWIEPPAGRESDLAIRWYGASITVADSAEEAGVVGDTRAAVDAALAAGTPVAFTSGSDGDLRVTLHRETWTDGHDRPDATTSDPLDVRLVAWPDELGAAPAQLVVPTAVAERLHLDVATSFLRLSGDVDEATQTRIEEAVGGAVDGTYLYVERGYQRPDEVLVILLVLGALGGVMMLGGTLTATFLALSDARPDLATLAAVGAAPRTRRRVAAAYALVVGVVGSLLGAAIGFVPGIAISRPLTALAATGDQWYLDVPWLLVAAVVLVLPLLTAAVVGLTARSRLPLVARLD